MFTAFSDRQKFTAVIDHQMFIAVSDRQMFTAVIDHQTFIAVSDRQCLLQSVIANVYCRQ